MDSDGTALLITLIVTVFVKAYFTACEHAMIEVSDSKVKDMAEKNKKYAELLKLIEKPRRTLQTFATFKALANVLIAILSYSLINSCLFPYLSQFWHETVSTVLSLIVILIVTVVVSVSLTETLPKRLVEKRAENFALKCTGIVKTLNFILAPLSSLTFAFGYVICKLFGVSTSVEKESVTEEEIKMMVEAGNETGLIEESQCEMINNIFEFGDSTVSDVMTHRTDLVAIDIRSKIGDIVYLAINEGFSRIPVYEKNVDSIVGIIYVKDLLCLVGCEHSEDFTIRQFMRKPLYIPETLKCSEAFEMMGLKKAQVAIVVDEYGGTAGMVTMEDLLEEIVGNIQDEYDDEESEFTEITDGVFIISGSADPEDIAPKLNITLPSEHQYDTMSAFVVDLLGRIPTEDESPSVKYQNTVFTILLTEDNWISKIKAVVTPGNDNDTET